MELYQLTVHEARTALEKGEISPVELTNAVYKRIDSVEDKVKAYITLTREHASTQAAKTENRIKKRGGGILLGIPLAIKDNMCTEGIRTTCASKILDNFIPPYESTNYR